jgi:4a-hydroxytetrahydrobiopterin dehydratase
MAAIRPAMASALADEPVDTDATDDQPLTESEYETYLPDIDGDVWDVIDGHHLDATYEFADFRDALEFTYEIGELAEDAWHHPDISLQWGEVGVELWTHDVDGLQKPDFVMAAKMDRIYDDYD